MGNQATNAGSDAKVEAIEVRVAPLRAFAYDTVMCAYQCADHIIACALCAGQIGGAHRLLPSLQHWLLESREATSLR